MNRSNLGAYLFAVRVSRREQNISKYLKRYRMNAIGENYYRDLEAGRKVLRLETAKELCRELGLERKPFFYHLLKDVLADDVFEEVIRPEVIETMQSLSEELILAKNDMELIQEAFSKQIGVHRTEVSDDVVRELDNNFDILPVIHFVYMKNSCSFKEVESIIQKNKISSTIDEIVEFLSKNKLAFIEYSTERIVRNSRVFKIPVTPKGLQFKNRFLLKEYEKSSSTNNGRNEDGLEETWSYSAIHVSSESEIRKLISNEGTRFVARLEAGEMKLGDANSTPYFVSIVVSPRREYDA